MRNKYRKSLTQRILEYKIIKNCIKKSIEDKEFIDSIINESYSELNIRLDIMSDNQNENIIIHRKRNDKLIIIPITDIEAYIHSKEQLDVEQEKIYQIQELILLKLYSHISDLMIPFS